ncbi:MAG: FAD-dependent oxidoreductase [Steroidobacteraceae bacterium]|jgi:NADPH-dependent 2,4-dienoyl-CoA reductase/sulfur reductase-like enzyme|nr:FAD-dependent oxidoreductase [Steroidobacteraceae bacterium]
MRVRIRGVERAGPPFAFTVGDRRIEAWPGETVAAALVAAGHWTCRETRAGEPRGPFCGMGVCGECTMTIDGQPKRACLEPARPGMVVAVQPARAVLPAAAAPELHESATLEAGVLVIGAGPAGLAAAYAAAAAGADVLVVDDRAKFGGQYYKQPGEGFRLETDALDAQYRAGRERHDAARRAGARFLHRATVWGAFGPEEIAVSTADRRLRIRARRVVVAPGAYERALAVPGWTLPGVITTGAAQTLLRANSVAPGRRVLLAGNGPLNLQVARELARAGVTVVAVAELAPAPGPRALADLFALTTAAPELVREGLGHVAALTAKRVPRLHSTVLVRCEPDASGTRVGRAVLARVDAAGRPRPGTERGYDVDAVCMGYGFAPQSELARALGCEYRHDVARGTLAAVRDFEGRTNVPAVFVIGDAGGLDGAKLAEAEGLLAGVAAARDLGRACPAPLAGELERARRRRVRHRRFQDALWRIYRAPPLSYELATAGTPVCRCEGVDRGTLEGCFASGVRSLGAAKRATRAGMGRCQGRYCGVALAAMAGAHGQPIADDGGWFAPRTPFRPVRIDQLAAKPDA